MSDYGDVVKVAQRASVGALRVIVLKPFDGFCLIAF